MLAIFDAIATGFVHRLIFPVGLGKINLVTVSRTGLDGTGAEIQAPQSDVVCEGGTPCSGGRIKWRGVTRAGEVWWHRFAAASAILMAFPSNISRNTCVHSDIR